MWQDSNIGNYIEFKLMVTYHEGHENAGIRQSMVSPMARQSSDLNQADSNKWFVYKRYSNFVDLHEALTPYFTAEGIRMPPLPPRIANESNSIRNQALTQRKNQLQAYLRQIMLSIMDRAPTPLLQFLGLHDQSQLGFYSLEPVALLSAVNLRKVVNFDIIGNKITFVNNAPKIFYKVVLRYRMHAPIEASASDLDQSLQEEEVVTFK